MTPETVLTFDTDGRAHGLYTEAIPLHALGRLSIRRATTIEFDDASQCWVVRDLWGGQLYHHSSRQECLHWERNLINHQEQP